MLSNSEFDHFESRGADVGPGRWSHQGTALSHLNPHRKCLGGDAVLTVIWGHRFVWGNLHELKQPPQSKEPTHFITAPAHQA